MTEYGNSKGEECRGTKRDSTLATPRAEKPTMEELAPDGGWGWMIAAGMIVIYIVCFAQGASLGLIYGDFLLQSEYGGSALTALDLMSMTSFSLSGLVNNELLKRYNIKHVGILGSALYATASTVACLVPNIPCLALLFFLQGLGVGISLAVCNISLNSYFVIHRAKVFGAVHAMIGLVLTGYPFMITHFLKAYGFRGCLALLGALSFNGVVCMTLMDPVELHYKKSDVIPRKDTVDHDPRNSSGNIVNGKGKIDPIGRRSVDAPKDWEENNSDLSVGAEAEHETPLLLGAMEDSHESQDLGGSAIDVEAGFRSRPGKGSSVNRLSVSEAVSMSSINGLAALGKVQVEKNVLEGKKSIRSVLADFFEVSLLRDRVYLNISIGMSMVYIVDLIFVGFLPIMMEDKGFTKQEVALTLTVYAIVELGAKVLFAVFSVCFDVKARHNFLVGIYALAICRIVLVYCNSLRSIIVVVSISGLTRTWYMLPLTLVLVEHSKIEKFNAAWGLYTIITGMTSIFVCPLIGLIRDLTQSYVITQYALIFGLLLCAVSWTIELVVCRIVSRDKITEKPSPK